MLTAQSAVGFDSIPRAHALRGNRRRERQTSRRLPLICRGAVEGRTARTDFSGAPAELKRLLQSPGLHLGPCAHDGLSARLIERAGFNFMFMSGFCVSASQLGMPDAGLMSYGEMVDVGRMITAATRLPVIGDGDTGYGNAMNCKRTVRGYAQAGFAGVLIEDQVAPKQCGHMRTRAVVSREEAVSRIRAAVDARDEGANILIAARSDSRSTNSIEEALWRAAAFADQGADILFIDALRSREEMRAFCKVAPHVPKMANMLEGGSTPILTPAELEDMGFKICAYPLSLLGVSIKAMEDALVLLRKGVVSPPDKLPDFPGIQAAVGFPEYYTEEAKYATAPRPPPQPAAPSTPPPPPPPPPSPPPPPAAEASSSATASYSSSVSVAPTAAPVEVEIVSTGPSAGGSSDAKEGDYEPGKRGSFTGDWLRVRVSDGRTGVVKMDMRVPAGFLGSLPTIMPSVAGVDLEGMLKDVLPLGNVRGAGERKGGGEKKRLIDVHEGSQRIEVFLE